MKSLLTKLLLLFAGILSLTPSWGQADTLCVAAPTGTYHVLGWAGSTFTWDTQGNGVIQSGQGNDTVVISWTTVPGTYQLQVIETSSEGCLGPPQVIDVVIIPGYTVDVDASICLSSSYTLPDGSIVSTAGDYPVNLTSVLGCDSLVTTHLSVLQDLNTTINASICLGDSYTLPDGSSVNNSGSYVVNLIAVGGCDSIITTNITLNQPTASQINTFICQGDNYTLPDGSIVSSAGVYPVTLTANNGCDSVITTTIQLHTVTNTPLTASICSGASYTLPDGTLASSTGTYVSTLQAVTGCDSLVTVTLTVIQAPNVQVNSSQSTSFCVGATTTLTASGADTYIWSPATYLSGTTGSSVTANPTDTITYSITGVVNSCSTTVALTLNAIANPVLLINPINPSICTGDSATLQITGAATYTWSPGLTLSSTNSASVFAFPTTTTTYSVIGTSGICNSTSSVTVTVIPLPVLAFTISDTTICEGGNSLITLQGASSYTWQPNSTLNIISEDSIQVNPGIETTYYVTGSSGSCSVSDSVTIDVQPIPSIALTSSPDSTCAGSSVELSVSGADTYFWSPSTGLSSTTADTVSAEVFNDITYYVTGSVGGCSKLDSVFVHVISSPHLVLTPESTTLCAGDSTLLSVSGADSYAWSPADSVACPTCPNIYVSPLLTSSYEIIGTKNGCTDTSSVLVTVYQRPNPLISGDTTMCPDDNILLEASGGSTYLWNTGDTTATITVSPTQTQVYSVLVNEGVCPDSTEHLIVVFPAPVILISEDTTIQEGGSAQIVSSGAYQYFWAPSANLSCDNCPSPIASPSETTTYCVTGLNFYGCSSSECVKISVEIICDDFFIPNVFAPGNGGDPENDCFRLYGTNCISELNFRIYNRWGELVFETNDPEICWDGTFHGQEQNAGVFVYYLKAKLINEESIEKQGNITLIR